jgi:hypothetical protein
MGNRPNGQSQTNSATWECIKSHTAAYGWIDLDLGYGFHTTVQDRLLALNHAWYEQEVVVGCKTGCSEREAREEVGGERSRMVVFKTGALKADT